MVKKKETEVQVTKRGMNRPLGSIVNKVIVDGTQFIPLIWTRPSSMSYRREKSENNLPVGWTSFGMSGTSSAKTTAKPLKSHSSVYES